MGGDMTGKSLTVGDYENWGRSIIGRRSVFLWDFWIFFWF
jgi:hypothetical protein